jgi:hypothetical protein
VTPPEIPQTYAQWHHCITVECGIALTRRFAETRLTVLRDPGRDETRRFAQRYGPAHLAHVREWFEQALEDVPEHDRETSP